MKKHQSKIELISKILMNLFALLAIFFLFVYDSKIYYFVFVLIAVLIFIVDTTIFYKSVDDDDWDW